MTYEPITRKLTSFDGTQIVYDVYDTGSPHLAVIVPGFWRDRKHLSMRMLAESFQPDHSVIVIDSRGHGDSGGLYGFNRLEHHDTAEVLKSIAALNHFDTIDLVGLSMGGAIAISTAARHPELAIRSLLLISSVAEFRSISPRINLLHLHRHLALGQAFRRPRFEWSFLRTAKLNALADVATLEIPICLIHMRNDWLISHDHSERIFEAAAGPKELHLLDDQGAMHADRIYSVAGMQAGSIIAGFWRSLDKKSRAEGAALVTTE